MSRAEQVMLVLLSGGDIGLCFPRYFDAIGVVLKSNEIVVSVCNLLLACSTLPCFDSVECEATYRDL